MAMKQNKQGKKFILIFIIFVFVLVVGEIYISHEITSDYTRLMQEQRKSSVSKMVHLAYNTILPVLNDVRDGKIDSDEAQKQITDLVDNMTYEDEYGKNYIFMSSYKGIMLVQPYEPQKIGSNQWLLQDADGRYIIQELVKAAETNPSGSFVTYDYYLPAEERVEEKLSYVIGIPEINAYIGTGMYMETSYKELQRILELQRYSFTFLLILIIGAAAIYIRALLKTNRSLSKEIRDRMYAEGNIRTVFDSIHDAVIIHDIKGNILLSNERACILYGIPENQITNYNIRELSLENPELILSQTNNIESTSLVFEWKCRRPIEDTTFDGEVALRNSKWSGNDVIVAVVRDISERKKYEEEIHHLAYYDYLTALHNRVFIMNALKKELEEGASNQKNGAVIFIDLDNFKKINDNFGHFFGDEVLIQLADKLKTLISDCFLPARIGGDEFVILCQGADAMRAAEIAEEILEIFRYPIIMNDNRVNVTCSMGVALFPKDGQSVEELFMNADMALYSAKYRGKDKYVFYEDMMSTEMKSKTEMEKQLHHAFHNNEFVLYYQPIYDLKQKQITGYEALIRWDSPEHGIVSPDKFIPTAEEIGLIDKIGEWVIDKTFDFAKHVQTISSQERYISCNVSSVQLSQANFVERVMLKFDEYQLRKGCVAFEITESSLIDNFDEAAQKLSQLRERGILIYLDDFGTGYSSLNYLKNLPIDSIKIDKSFIDDIVKPGIDSKILKTIVSLAHAMGIKTVAEGVETEEQYQLLETCNCDLIQGYLISRPKPEEEIKKSFT